MKIRFYKPHHTLLNGSYTQLDNFDLVKVHVAEHLNLAFSFSCSEFTHVAKRCNRLTCTYKCGGHHSANDY